jgi:hypothetical protein
MNPKQRATRDLSAHPVRSNIDPRTAVFTFEASGAEVTRGGAGEIIIKLKSLLQGPHDPRHIFGKETFSPCTILEAAEIDPARDFQTGATIA